ncbi:hypothetical protein C672_3569 [[Clostridium] bifermentans ATCC 638]|uniref:Uncharacterized protein n=1 Tax=Paraclostridium bifermentans ATCC 638 = DSM 14991 TaxID=1233171 RepID=T4VGW2_PARBF|nr:hypothetical protein [Paraclostridium bifermentans]EQK40001.1 hypothetical protein C672_3569 [[Clostridium] bifermentans ATCC 638] [Paraclostridium bifermentans ATCC 638 = DSM 14991]
MASFISIYKTLKEILQFLILIITIYNFVDVQRQKSKKKKNKKKQKKVSSKKRRNF